MKWSLLACLLLLFVGLWTWHRTAEPPLEVKVASPVYNDVSNLVTTDGMVEPTLEFQARANFSGMIEKVAVELGDKVSNGQLLVTMKDPFATSRIATAASAMSFAGRDNEDIHRGGTQEERIQLANDLDHMRAQQAAAEQGLKAREELEREGAASAAEVGAAHMRLDDVNRTLQALQQRSTERFSPTALHASQVHLADTREALAAAKETFNNAHIASPMVGTVYSISVAPYDFVNLGADLLRVADLNQMQVRAYFDEPEVGKLKSGQVVTLTWDGRPGLVWHGHIRQAPVAAKVMGSRSVAECLIKVDDANGALLPNTHVVVSVPIEKHLHVLTIPRQALQADGASDTVLRVVDGMLVRTPVVTGLATLDMIEIVQGLSPQDRIAVHALNNLPLSNNLRVTPVP